LADVFVSPTVTIHPGEVLTGSYDLTRMLQSEQVPADVDLVVLWRYAESVPDSTTAISNLTGIAIVHTPKASDPRENATGAP
jgi:hypothetical protein